MKPKRYCLKCGMPLSYWNMGEYCFRHTPDGCEWKIRRSPYNPHALTYPWDAEDDLSGEILWAENKILFRSLNTQVNSTSIKLFKFYNS